MPGTCLIVEDDPHSIELFAIAIKKQGFHVIGAQTGEFAIETLNTNIPDVVVLDLRLPGISGEKVLEYIRQAPHLAKVRVLVVSAHGDMMIDPSLIDARLVKPVRIRDLVDNVIQLFQQTLDDA